MRDLRINIFLITLLCSMGACSNLKYLQDGQALYNGAEIKINETSQQKIADEKALKSSLKDITRPQPNKKLLGMRYKLWFYNIAGTPKKQKGFKYWLKNKMGEPPVLVSSVNIENNANILQSLLLSQGYLQATAQGDTVIKGKTGKAIYEVETSYRYTINEINFPNDSIPITKEIANSAATSLLKKGDYYSLDVFKSERERIDVILKEKGYFYFNPDYILLQVDSTIGNHQVNIFVQLKSITPEASLKACQINDINIYPNYVLQRNSAIRNATPIVHKDFKIYDRRETFKPDLFDRLVFFSKGETYNRKDHSLTLNRLVNIGTFKFIKADFVPIDSFRSNLLNTNLYLTPAKKKSLSLQVVGTSKSNNFVGSELKINHTNRNLFKRAEQLNLSLGGGFETQLSGPQPRTNSYTLSAEAKLIYPRFLFPLNGIKNSNNYIPKTHISLSGQLLKRALFYTLSSFKVEYGFAWKQNEFIEHTFNPASISYVNTINVTDSFSKMLDKLPTLKASFENQFIVASNYNFNYSNQLLDKKRNTTYFNAHIESAGNLASLFLKKNEAGKKTLFGTSLNQYIRLDVDYRNYHKLKPTTVLANRINLGFGAPYGNSVALPYVRQFFVGGSNDVRAFRARSIGPGTYDYNTQNDSQSGFFADQAGDIKLLLNSELRFKLFSIVHGAAFVDAGNIWLAKEDTSRVGGKFEFKNMLSELAVGGGVGLRVDASIFIIRFDLATPFRKPYLPKGNRWVFDEIKLGDPAWRKNNLQFNIGIGYPF